MSRKTAIIYWCEGTGHAARSIPVAKRFEEEGHEVKVIGGGLGQKFVEINGLDGSDEDITDINFTPRLRDDDKSFLTLAKEIVTEVIPSTVGRFRDIWGWLRKEDPDELLTDDPVAVLAASLQGQKFYRIDHLKPDLFDGIARLMITAYMKLSLLRGQEIFLTSVFQEDHDGDIVDVSPLAQEGELEHEVEEFDVLLIPGTYGESFLKIKEQLESQGLEVKMVGDEDWELVPSMTPYTEAADVVVCTGYSAIADSVVAGTPCVVYPFLYFQKLIAGEIEKKGLEGVETADSVEEAVSETEGLLESSVELEFRNGADEIVEHIAWKEQGRDEEAEKICMVYWCGGTGHAARSIPVAKEFRSRGVDVSIAGGGPGKKFVELNGFEHPDLTEAQDPAEFSLVDFLPRIFTDLVPSSAKRLRDIHRWLKEEDPDKLVTDDIFAALSASIQGIEFYRIDHLTPKMLPARWSIPLKVYNLASLVRGEEILVTSLWKEEEDPPSIKKVDPLAQEGEAGEVDDYDVLINPGSWGKNFDEIRSILEEKGYEVRTVGDEDWEVKSSMTPYTEAADVVVCTGFSSIADTVVAGTPCIVYPFLPFQKALADKAERKDIEGITRADSVEEIISSVDRYCSEGSESPEYENGAPELVDRVLED
ncbi:MAG: hypothetical protein ABEJ36_01345 [Candidatus Nanosalina sp.]